MLLYGSCMSNIGLKWRHLHFMYTLSYFDLGLKQNAPTQQWVLQETFTRAIKIEKEHSNFMKDIECYHQMLIDMKV